MAGYVERDDSQSVSSPHNDGNFLTIQEASDYLGYTPRWLREMAKKGMFYAVKVGRRWLFKKNLIDQYIREQNENDSK